MICELMTAERDWHPASFGQYSLPNLNLQKSLRRKYTLPHDSKLDTGIPLIAAIFPITALTEAERAEIMDRFYLHHVLGHFIP